MLASAFLTITAAAGHARTPDPAGQVPLTRNEIAYLFAGLTILPALDASYRMRWSHWRRCHQQRARQYRYQRQATQGP